MKSESAPGKGALEVVGDDKPSVRPRFENPAKEIRFRRDQAGWRRRICAARRLSYYGRDPVAPGGGWSR
jgi:hypothetical protein